MPKLYTIWVFVKIHDQINIIDSINFDAPDYGIGYNTKILPEGMIWIIVS